MRVPLIVRLLVSSFTLLGPWLVAGLAWSLLHSAVLAQEAQNERTVRLGFHFDQRAHDAAIAAEQKGGRLELGPADPDVVRLPKYDVRERRMPLREDELLTPEGRLALAKKRHLTPVYQKIFGPLAAVASLLNNPLGGWNPNGPEAMAIYNDNLNLQRRKELEGLNELAAFAEKVKQDRSKASAGRTEKPKKRGE